MLRPRLSSEMAVDRVAGRAATTVMRPARRTDPIDSPTRAKMRRWRSDLRDGAISDGFRGVLGGRSPPSAGVEPVADAPHGGDGHRVAQLLADLGHVDVDRAGVAVPAVAPDAVEDLLAGQGPPAVLGQVPEEFELPAGHVHR